MQNKCPACQKLLQMPDNAVGKRIKCPLCNHAFTVSQTGTGEFSPPGNKVLNDSEIQNLLQLLASYQRDMEKSMRERDEAMEMVDSFFQLFMQRGTNPNMTLSEQQEYRDTAQKLFALQKKFPLLGGLKDVMQRSSEAIRQLLARNAK